MCEYLDVSVYSRNFHKTDDQLSGQYFGLSIMHWHKLASLMIDNTMAAVEVMHQVLQECKASCCLDINKWGHSGEILHLQLRVLII